MRLGAEHGQAVRVGERLEEEAVLEPHADAEVEQLLAAERREHVVAQLVRPCIQEREVVLRLELPVLVLLPAAVGLVQLRGEPRGRREPRGLGRVARTVPVEDVHPVDGAPRWRLRAGGDAKRAALDRIPGGEVAPRPEHVELVAHRVLVCALVLGVGPGRDEERRAGLLGPHGGSLDECGLCAGARWPRIADLGREERGEVIGRRGGRVLVDLRAAHVWRGEAVVSLACCKEIWSRCIRVRGCGGAVEGEEAVCLEELDEEDCAAACEEGSKWYEAWLQWAPGFRFAAWATLRLRCGGLFDFLGGWQQSVALVFAVYWVVVRVSTLLIWSVSRHRGAPVVVVSGELESWCR